MQICVSFFPFLLQSKSVHNIHEVLMEEVSEDSHKDKTISGESIKNFELKLQKVCCAGVLRCFEFVFVKRKHVDLCEVLSLFVSVQIRAQHSQSIDGGRIGG